MSVPRVSKGGSRPPWRVALRTIWCILLVLHALGMIGYWWRKWPHGFPLTHPRFWVNEALPWVLSAGCVLVVIIAWLRRNTLFRIGILVMPVTYATVAISSLVIFPVSSTSDLRELWRLPWPFAWGFWLPLLGFAVVLAVMAVLAKGRARYPWGAVAAAVAVGIGLGTLFTWSQRAREPGTLPWSKLLPSPPETLQPIPPAQTSLAADMTIDAENAEVAIRRGALELKVRPILTFFSRSPDSCWTALAPLRLRQRRHRPLVSAGRHKGDSYFEYGGAEPALMCVKDRQAGEPLEIEAWTKLPAPVFSHLNHLCRVTVQGYHRLSMSFSPCPQQRIEMSPHSHPDYCIAQGFAYLDASGGFHWAKGSRQEKGPFRHLASGRLERGEPLTVMLHDEARPVFRILVRDWSSQLSTRLSPTAGWGVPANAITAFVEPKRYGSPADISFQLAATGVGSGYDSVGHTAGTYRSRIRIEPVVEP